MKTLILPLAVLLALSACGVDGEPTPPEPKASSKPGLSITGRAEFGVRKTS